MAQANYLLLSAYMHIKACPHKQQFTKSTSNWFICKCTLWLVRIIVSNGIPRLEAVHQSRWLNFWVQPIRSGEYITSDHKIACFLVSGKTLTENIPIFIVTNAEKPTVNLINKLWFRKITFVNFLHSANSTDLRMKLGEAPGLDIFV